MAEPQAFELDAINRRAWKSAGTVRTYQRLEGWTDPGEEVVLRHVAGEAAGQPILDIGVGGGRTTSLLQAISRDYIGVDYTPEMVQACRARHPGVRIMHMDARDLSAFANNQFALVYFSYNGIDAVDYAGRQKVLREVRRVLRPQGLFVFSAHNREAAEHQRPHLQLPFTWNPLKLGWRVLKAARSQVQSWRNWRRYRGLNERHDDWSVLNCAAHDFGIVIVYMTPAGQQRQLQAEGFRTELVVDNLRGEPMADGADTRAVQWFHYVARRCPDRPC